MKTSFCTCPDGYIVDNNGGCTLLPPLSAGCERDDDCDEHDACINAICKDPCACGLNAECTIVNHRPVCTCKVRMLK